MTPFALHSLPANQFSQHPLPQELHSCWNCQCSSTQRPENKLNMDFSKLGWSDLELTFQRKIKKYRIQKNNY